MEKNLDLIWLIPTVAQEEFEDVGSYVKMAVTRNQALWEDVSNNICEAQETMKHNYNRIATESDIVAGDLVLVKDENRSDSLSPLYKSHKRVLKKKKANVIVGDLELNQEKVVHLNRCRKVPGPENCLDESTIAYYT